MGGEGNEFTAFVRGLPFETQEDEVQRLFAQCGEIEDLRMPLNEERKSRGIAFITFTDTEALNSAKQLNETEFAGRTIYVIPAGERVSSGKGKGNANGSKGKGKGNEFTAFVRNLPFQTQEDELKKLFADCGQIENLRMPLNEEGKCRGIAFLTFKSAKALDMAKELMKLSLVGVQCMLRGQAKAQRAREKVQMARAEARPP